MRPNVTAIIYDKKGRVLSIGKNSYIKTHPLQAKLAKAVGEPNKIYLHAEIAAIVKLKNLKEAHRIEIFRFGADGSPRSSCPCRVCQRAIRKAGIKKVSFTT